MPWPLPLITSLSVGLTTGLINMFGVVGFIEFVN